MKVLSLSSHLFSNVNLHPCITALAEVSEFAEASCAPGMGSAKVRRLCDIFRRLEDLVEGRLEVAVEDPPVVVGSVFFFFFFFFFFPPAPRIMIMRHFSHHRVVVRRVLN